VRRGISLPHRSGWLSSHLHDRVWNGGEKCDHIAGKQILPTAELADKICAAVACRSDTDLLIIARTDTLALTGLDDAIARGNLYREAGADVIVVEAPESSEEVEEIVRRVAGPLMINMVTGGKTPTIPAADLGRLGYIIVIFPAVYHVGDRIDGTGTSSAARD